MKLVPDETGSREQRQRKGCFRQGKERTDLSLVTLPVALKKTFISHSLPFSFNCCHIPILFGCLFICFQILFLCFAILYHTCFWSTYRITLSATCAQKPTA